MSENHAAELERQQLIKRCHSLVAIIASRPGSTKLLLGVVPTLEFFAAYKANRRLPRGQCGTQSRYQR